MLNDLDIAKIYDIILVELKKMYLLFNFLINILGHIKMIYSKFWPPGDTTISDRFLYLKRPFSDSGDSSGNKHWL